MNVAAILKSKGSDVACVAPSVSVQRAATLLNDHKIGALVVTDDSEVLGIFSERDIVRALAREGQICLQRTVREIMTERVVTCSPEDSIEHVMGLMTGGRFRHLPVIDDGYLVGIVSIGDVVKHRIAETEFEAEALRLYIATG